MSEFSREDIGRALSSRDPDAFEAFLRQYALSHYTFCMILCLGRGRLAKSLFQKAAIKAFKAGVKPHEDLNEWLYKSIHSAWKSLARFNKNLKSQPEYLKLDWANPVGQQHADALVVLTPVEREVFLHRMLNKYDGDRLVSITGIKKKKVTTLFEKASQKMLAL